MRRTEPMVGSRMGSVIAKSLSQGRHQFPQLTIRFDSLCIDINPDNVNAESYGDDGW
jgi:hypothetical protein